VGLLRLHVSAPRLRPREGKVLQERATNRDGKPWAPEAEGDTPVNIREALLATLAEGTGPPPRPVAQ